MGDCLNGDCRELIKKLCKISHDIGVIEKEKAKGLQYAFHTEASFMTAIRGRLFDANIFICTSVTSSEYLPDEGITHVKTRHIIMCGDTGATITCTSEGHGKSVEGKDGYVGDKGIYKAITGSMKYFLGKNFMISDREDPEYDQGEIEEKPINRQAQTLTQGQPISNAASTTGGKFSLRSDGGVPPETLLATINANKDRTVSGNTPDIKKQLAQACAIGLDKLCVGFEPRILAIKHFLIGSGSFNDCTHGQLYVIVKWINMADNGAPDPQALLDADEIMKYITEKNIVNANALSAFETAILDPGGLAVERLPVNTPAAVQSQRFERKVRI